MWLALGTPQCWCYVWVTWDLMPALSCSDSSSNGAAQPNPTRMDSSSWLHRTLWAQWLQQILCWDRMGDNFPGDLGRGWGHTRVGGGTEMGAAASTSPGETAIQGLWCSLEGPLHPSHTDGVAGTPRAGRAVADGGGQC